MNVFDYAIQLEKDGRAFYLDLASEAKELGVKNIFTMLADDEKKHLEIFQELKQASGPPAMEDSTTLEKTKGIFTKLMERKNELISLAGSIEAYRRGMEVEDESVRLYTEAAAKETRDEVKQLLLRIAKEEQKHFNILENLYTFANSPNQYLEWGEFSNPGDFGQFGRKVDM